MKKLVFALVVSALAGGVAVGQERGPSSIKTVMAGGGVEVRYLDFAWNPEAFAALEQGGTAPQAQRSWLLARIFTPEPLKWDGHDVPGGSLLVLHPASGDAPLTLEWRKVDMREVFKDLNVIAEPPAGETLYRAPAGFEKVAAVAPRLDITLKEADGKLRLTLHYGDRQATAELTR